MIVQPVDYLLVAWFAVGACSTAYVAWDQFRNNPEPGVMKWGFVLVTLYMGPLGLLLYVLADKEPRPGAHEQFTAALWKQGVGSTIHCVAGDATGIILAAAITATLGLPMWIDLLVEYAAGFAFGLFIFQSLFMKEVMGGTYWENVRNTFLPEFISMNAMMAGMAPVMSFLMMGRDMHLFPFHPVGSNGGDGQRRWPSTCFWHSTNSTLSGSRGRGSVTLTSVLTVPGWGVKTTMRSAR